MSKIIDRAGKGSAISAAENDANLSSLSGINEAVAGTTHTIDVDDQNKTIEYTSASAVAVTLSDIATILSTLQTDDFKVTLIATGAGTVTITPDGTDSINTGGATIVLETDEYVTIQTDSTNAIWNVISSSDASKVDGLDASQFIRSDANDTASGDISFTGAITVDTVTADTTNADLALAGDGSGIVTTDTLGATTTNADLTLQGNGTGGVAGTINKDSGSPNTLSSTAVTVTGIPSWAKRVTVTIYDLSTDAADTVLLRLGTSGGIDATSYETKQAELTNAAAVVVNNSNTGFICAVIDSGEVIAERFHGTMVLTLHDATANIWMCESQIAHESSAIMRVGAGMKTLSGTLTQISLVNVGANNFDNGEMSVYWE